MVAIQTKIVENYEYKFKSLQNFDTRKYKFQLYTSDELLLTSLLCLPHTAIRKQYEQAGISIFRQTSTKIL